MQARLQRLESLVSETSPTRVRGVLQLALADADPEVREEALSHLALIPSTEAAPLVQRLIAIEPVAAVRHEALETVGEWKGPEAVPVLAAALRSPHRDSKLIASSQLTLRADKPALEALLPALQDPDAEVRDKIGDQLFFLINRRFRDYGEAITWWRAHEHEFDAELFRTEPAASK